MKKIFLSVIVFCLLSMVFIPFIANADGLVPCNPTCDNATGTCSGQCTITDLFKILANVYDFIVKDIASPLAVIAFIIAGILILTSAGNPSMLGLGKKIFYAAVIGLALAWCSWLIIDFIMKTLGYSLGTWSTLSSFLEYKAII